MFGAGWNGTVQGTGDIISALTANAYETDDSTNLELNEQITLLSG